MASTTVSVMAKAPAPAMTTAMERALAAVMNAAAMSVAVEKAMATATATVSATAMAMVVAVVTAEATTTVTAATCADATMTNYSRRHVMTKKYIVKKDDKVILETESEAKAERLYEKLISDRKERYESVELTYPPWSDRCTDGGVRIP